MKMVNMHHFHQSIKEYSALGKKNLFPDLYGCPNPCCPYEGMLYHHAFYARNALAMTATYVVLVQRYYCPVCKRTVSLLPSFLAPHYQYTMGCIFFILFHLYFCRQNLSAIAKKIDITSGRSELSHQHICFYRRRFLRNLPLLAGFLGSRGIPIASPTLLPELFVAEIRRCGLSSFSLDYFSFQSRHFLSG
jgi:hypothetical protein